MKTFLAALLAAISLPVAAADAAPCQLAQIAVWPVRLQFGLPVVDGAINGHRSGVMLDTGAWASMITKDAAVRLDLYTRATGEYATGVGGESAVLWTRVKELRIGDANVDNLRVRVIGERPIPGVEFIVGEDFFRKLDVEFDYAKGQVRLYQPSPACKGSWLAYWDKDALQVPLDSNAQLILIPVKVNGREATALLDSGAASSVVSLHFASRLGITPKTPGVQPASCVMGLGSDAMSAWVAPFDSISVGGETIRDAKLRIVDLERLSYGREGADLILGTDFLRAHRVLVSRHQDKVYFSYAGGQVFPHTAQLECDDRLKDARRPEEGLAAFDAALAKDPRDLKALLGRAALRAASRNLEGARGDLDAALAIDPSHGVARQQRMNVRIALHDYAGALEDADAALANGMRSADLYIARALIREGQGDESRALQEIDAALKLDPLHPTALQMRGVILYDVGRYEDAEKSFQAHFDVQHDRYDAIWIFLSRARRGVDGRAVLEKSLENGNAAWPGPVVRYLLGRTDAATVLQLATADERQRSVHECEARYYMAQGLIASGRRDEARPLLEKARDECPRDQIEYNATLVELAKAKGAGA